MTIGLPKEKLINDGYLSFCQSSMGSSGAQPDLTSSFPRKDLSNPYCFLSWTICGLLFGANCTPGLLETNSTEMPKVSKIIPMWNVMVVFVSYFL